MNLKNTLSIALVFTATLILTGCTSRQSDAQNFETLFNQLPPWRAKICETTHNEGGEALKQEAIRELSRGNCLISAAFRYYDGVKAQHYSKDSCMTSEVGTGDCARWLYTTEDETHVDGPTLLDYDQCLYEAGIYGWELEMDDDWNLLFDVSKASCLAAQACAHILDLPNFVSYEWSETIGCHQQTQSGWQGERYTQLGYPSWGIVPSQSPF